MVVISVCCNVVCTYINNTKPLYKIRNQTNHSTGGDSELPVQEGVMGFVIGGGEGWCAYHIDDVGCGTYV